MIEGSKRKSFSIEIEKENNLDDRLESLYFMRENESKSELKKVNQSHTRVDPGCDDGWDFIPNFLRRSWSGSREAVDPEKGSFHNKKDGEGRMNLNEGRKWFSRFHTEFAKESAGLSKEIAREVARNMWTQADRVKSEAFKMLASEAKNLLKDAATWNEVRNMLHGLTLDVEMKIRLNTRKEDVDSDQTSCLSSEDKQDAKKTNEYVREYSAQ